MLGGTLQRGTESGTTLTITLPVKEVVVKEITVKAEGREL